MWLFFESCFLINFILLVLPINISAKRLVTGFFAVVLSGANLSFLFLNLRLFEILTFKEYFSLPVPDNFFAYNPYIVYTLFGTPIIFSVDNLSAVFCFLTTFLTFICIIITWKDPSFCTTGFYFLLFSLCFSLFHVFTCMNLLFFYLLFELTLVPMFIIILTWGSRQRKVYAAYLFFLYTVVGSFLLLFGIILLYSQTNTLFITSLYYLHLPYNFQLVVWFLFFFGFSVKVPIVPFHGWLPEAHVEAPTIGSIILAGLLLKVGTFGMLRFIFPFLFSASNSMGPLVFFLSLLSIYHASLVALRQIDLKKLIAYSSIAHMGFVVAGLFSNNIYSFVGSFFIMISHGIVSGGLFFLVGVLYDRYGSKAILDYGGLATIMPNFSIAFFLFTLANLSFPGTSNFIGELLVLLGLSEVNIIVTAFATFSIVLTSAYSIWACNRLIFGVLNPRLLGFSDFNKSEFWTAALLIFLMLIFGLRPSLLLNNLEKVVFYLNNYYSINE